MWGVRHTCIDVPQNFVILSEREESLGEAAAHRAERDALTPQMCFARGSFPFDVAQGQDDGFFWRQDNCAVTRHSAIHPDSELQKARILDVLRAPRGRTGPLPLFGR